MFTLNNHDALIETYRSDAVGAALRAQASQNPANRDLYRRNALACAEGLRCAETAMSAEAVEIIAEVMSEALHDEVEKYVCSHIPSHQLDDLWDAFSNIIDACLNGDSYALVNEAYFVRLDSAIAAFKKEHAILFGY